MLQAPGSSTLVGEWDPPALDMHRPRSLCLQSDELVLRILILEAPFS